MHDLPQRRDIKQVCDDDREAEVAHSSLTAAPDIYYQPEPSAA